MNFVDTGEYIIRAMCLIFGIVLGFGLTLCKKDKDIEPIIHAHWKDDGHGYYVCSHCEDYIVTDEDGNPPSFFKSDWVLNVHRCPHCGAKMDEVQE